MSAAPISEALTKKITIVAIFFLLAILGYEGEFRGLYDTILPNKLPTEVPIEIGTYHPVTKVTDGDTLRVAINGIEEPIRLIGINTPESVDPRRTVECFGKEASVRMKELAEGKLVRLEYDASQGERDAYNRLLAYVYLEDGQMLNRKMLADGYAYEYTYLTPYRYQSEFRDLQRFARSEGRGLWSSTTCSGKK